METEDLVFDNGSKGQIVEKFCELFPHISVAVLSQALVVKTVPVIKAEKVNKFIKRPRQTSDSIR